MDQVAHSISLDVKSSVSKVCLPIKQNDTGHYLRISLTDGGSVYDIGADCTAVLQGKKPDGKEIFNACEVKNNRIEADITPEMVATVGEVRLEVVLYNAKGETVTSALFGLVVIKRALSDSEVESSPEFTALQRIMARSDVKELENRINTVLEAEEKAIKSAEAAEEAAKSAGGSESIAGSAAQRALSDEEKAAEAAAAAEQSAKECSELVAEVEQKLESGEFTPVKGVDYFTPEEKKEMVNDVLASLPRDITITSWRAVQEVVRAGKATEVFSIGDQIECQHEVYGTLLWDVIGIDHDTPTDSQYEHSITLQLHDCLPVRLGFDAAEPNNPVSLYAKYGSNIWRDSNIRQWLNSDAEAGNWWEAQTDYDVAPAYASTHAGFMRGLDEDFLSVIGAVYKDTKITSPNESGVTTTVDKFFLLSATEINGGINQGVAEGTAYGFYVLYSDLSSATMGADTNRIKYSDGVAVTWGQRSPYYNGANGAYNIRSVTKIGGGVQHGANASIGLAPACCIY